MTNEFGVKLDYNGYAPSVIDRYDSTCMLCRKRGDLVRHEVFHGTANRAISKRLGAWVYLCPACHHALHNTDPALDWELHQIGQLEVMKHYDWSVKDFRERFGKSYVEETK